MNWVLQELRDKEGEREMYNMDVSELKANIDRLQRINTRVGRDKDYWRHLSDKLKEDLRLASHHNAHREAKVRVLGLANHNQQHTIYHNNTQIAKMEEVIDAQRSPLSSQQRHHEDDRKEYDQRIAALEEELQRIISRQSKSPIEGRTELERQWESDALRQGRSIRRS